MSKKLNAVYKVDVRNSSGGVVGSHVSGTITLELTANPSDCDAPGWKETFTYDAAYKDGSWTIQQGKTLKFRYRVFIHHGDYKLAKVAEAYQEYAAHER